METKQVLFSTLWIATLICINFKATDATFGKKRTDFEVVEPEPKMYIEEESITNSDYFEKKCKEDVSNIQQQNQLQKTKSLLQLLKREKKSEMLTFKGWSASGMPFNVLYIPNSIHHKILTSLNYASANRLPPTPKLQEPEIRQEYLPMKKQQKKLFEKLDLRSPNLRKHILVIPHLFVSYGWSPIGK